MLVNIYVKPHCPACNQAKRLMKKKGIEFTEAPFTDEVLEFAKKRGFSQAPVTTVYHVGDTVNDVAAWDGFRPDRINKLAEEQ